MIGTPNNLGKYASMGMIFNSNCFIFDYNDRVGVIQMRFLM